MSNKSWWERGKVKNLKPRDADIPDTIKDWELDKGGWRYDERNTGYNLTWEQLLEYEQKNLETLETWDIKQFDDWFADFRKEHGITSRSYGGGYSSGSYSSYWEDDDSFTSDKGKKDKWLSSWWSKDWKGSAFGSNKDATRLAVVLQAVRTTVRAVDDTVPPLTVRWAEQDDQSYTNFDKHEIAINPAPVRDKQYEDGKVIDITTGFALHEAGHSKYTREPYKDVLNPEPLRPLQVAAWLLNFAEDVRIESLIAEDFPGFAGYFEEVGEWLWEKSKDTLPGEYGPGLGEKVKSAFTIIRFPQAHPLLKHPSFAAEIPWWTNWRDDYLANKVGARDTIQRALDHLAEDPETKKEMEQMTSDEEAMEKAMGDLKKALEKMMQDFKEKHLKGMQTCSSEGDKPEALDEATADAVRKLVNEQLQIDQTIVKTADGHGNVPMHITRPVENADSKRAYIGKPKPVLHRLKAALIFRQELPRYTNRLLKEGNLDEEELWRWKATDYRVFSEEIIAARPQTQLSFLVDMSGSMYGNKLRSAQELAQLFVWALKEMEGVDTKVFGHTGDIGEIAANLYRLWEPGEPLTRLGLIQTEHHGNNYDGHAIAWCVRELMQRGQPEEQRILIVLSDGYPAGSDYGGPSGQRHVREVVNWADTQGVKVIQIAIDPSIDPHRQASMFKEFIQFTNLDDVPKQLTRLLSKLV